MPQKFSLDTVAKGENAQALERSSSTSGWQSIRRKWPPRTSSTESPKAMPGPQGFATEEDYRTDTEDTFVNKK